MTNILNTCTCVYTHRARVGRPAPLGALKIRRKNGCLRWTPQVHGRDARQGAPWPGLCAGVPVLFVERGCGGDVATDMAESMQGRMVWSDGRKYDGSFVRGNRCNLSPLLAHTHSITLAAVPTCHTYMYIYTYCVCVCAYIPYIHTFDPSVSSCYVCVCVHDVCVGVCGCGCGSCLMILSLLLYACTRYVCMYVCMDVYVYVYALPFALSLSHTFLPTAHHYSHRRACTLIPLAGREWAR